MRILETKPNHLQMRYLLFTFIFTLSIQTTFAQQLVLHTDFPGISWPFLWDLEQDANDNLYVCSEQGILYVKSDGIWETYDLDENSSADARGIAIDADGSTWVSTEEGLIHIENGAVTQHYTSFNSDLPSNNLRQIRFHDNSLWIALVGNGIARKQGETFTHYTNENSDLIPNSFDDIIIPSNGTVFVAYNEYLSFFKDEQWNTHNLKDSFGFQPWIEDMYLDHNEDIWLATWHGVLKYSPSTDQFEDFRETYGAMRYTKIIYTPNKELWLGQLFEGLHYYDDKGNHYFFEGNLTGQPSQVFDFLYHQDTVRVIGNIGATVTGLTIDLTDTNIDEFTDGQTKIFPNPTQNKLNIEFSGQSDYMVKLYDLQGKLILQEKNKSSINTSNIPRGIYLLEIADTETNQKKTIKRVVVTD